MKWVLVDPVLMHVYGPFSSEEKAAEASGIVHTSGELWVAPVEEMRDQPDPTIHPGQMVVQDYVGNEVTR